jgi:hypothetical protein
MRTATTLSACRPGEDYDREFVIDVDNTQNPDSSGEVAGSEYFRWESTGNWVAGMQEPDGLDPYDDNSIEWIVQLQGGVYKVTCTGYPVDAGFAQALIDFYGLTYLHTVDDHDWYEAKALVTDGFAVVTIDGSSYDVNPTGAGSEIKLGVPNGGPTNDAFYFYGEVDVGGAAMIAAMCAANPGLWGTDDMHITWSLNNLP